MPTDLTHNHGLGGEVHYSSARAAATITGKLMRYLELVAKGKAEMRVWDRPVDQPAGTIGQMFYEIFSVDENTRGCDLFKLLAPALERAPKASHQSIITDTLRESIKNLLNRVQKRGVGAQAKMSPMQLAQPGRIMAKNVKANVFIGGLPEPKRQWCTRRISAQEPDTCPVR